MDVTIPPSERLSRLGQPTMSHGTGLCYSDQHNSLLAWEEDEMTKWFKQGINRVIRAYAVERGCQYRKGPSMWMKTLMVLFWQLLPNCNSH